MGTEMITKATDNFQRKQRRSLERLEEPTLFSCAPQLSIVVLATPEPWHAFALGEEYRLAFLNNRLLVILGVTIVGAVENPPPSVIDMMRGPSPSAHGHIINVFSLTNKADLLLN